MEIKKLILLAVPVKQCNLQCDYCYISRTKGWKKEKSGFNYSVKHMLQALTKERLGGTCLINLTGAGETLIPKEMPSFIKGLLQEGHYLEVVTNGTLTRRFDEIGSFDRRLLTRLEFKFSFHYKELKRLNLLNSFVENVHKMQSLGCSFTIESMPYDDLADDIEEIKDFSLKNFGAFPQVTVGRDDMKNYILLTHYSTESYKNIWGQFNSTMFEYKMRIYEERPRYFCYAGDWSLLVDLGTGDAQPCYGQPVTQNIFKDISQPIVFKPVGHWCTMPYCVNGHALLALGLQPDFKGYSYFEIRNRKAIDEKNWFSVTCEESFSQKLFDNNKQLTTCEKIAVDVFHPVRYVKGLFYSKRKIVRRLRLLKQKINLN